MAGMREMNNTLRKSIFGGIICAVGAGVGGLIGGPIGIGFGSVIGGAISARLFGFRSAPTVIREDFSENEQRGLLERGHQALFDWKEEIIRVVLDLLNALFKSQSLKEFFERALMPILREFTYIGLEALIRYIVV